MGNLEQTAGQNNPTENELVIAKQIAGLRLMDRELGTKIRYAHEPRQIGKLRPYLESLGFVHVPPQRISDPRSMEPGTYTTGCMLESLQENDEILFFCMTEDLKDAEDLFKIREAY